MDYRFAVGDRLVLTVQPVGFSLYSVLSPNSSYLDSGTGAVSRFAALNPVLRIGNLDAGVGFDWLFSDAGGCRVPMALGLPTAQSKDCLAPVIKHLACSCSTVLTATSP